MIDYLNLKNCYITAVQAGLALTDYEKAKQGNTLIHKFCESCIDSSNYNELEKQKMKCDLLLTKESLSKEIEYYYHGDNTID